MRGVCEKTLHNASIGPVDISWLKHRLIFLTHILIFRDQTKLCVSFPLTPAIYPKDTYMFRQTFSLAPPNGEIIFIFHRQYMILTKTFKGIQVIIHLVLIKVPCQGTRMGEQEWK